MQVEASNSVNSINKTQTTNSNIENSSEVLFSSLLSKNVSPTDISYDEYKKLTTEDIENLFPRKDMPQENTKALSLHSRVNASDDETLNQVLFEKELESNGNTMDSFSIDLLIESKKVGKELNILLMENEYRKENNMGDKEEIPLEVKNNIEAKAEKNPTNGKITPEELFEYFDNFKIIQKDSEEVFSMFDDIQKEYEKRVSERDAILNSYTSNNKANPLENIKSA
ncbi:hypothetical protein [Arcobacter sp.]|uniref:hypothetical protein n=1 Tax=Arcobacter sp. TaxID=1872629 RepID=UPI003C723A14